MLCYWKIIAAETAAAMALRRKAGGGGLPGSPGPRQDNSGTPGLRPQKAVDATNCAGHAFSGSVNDSIKLPPGSAQFQGMSQVLDKHQLWRDTTDSTEY